MCAWVREREAALKGRAVCSEWSLKVYYKVFTCCEIWFQADEGRCAHCVSVCCLLDYLCLTSIHPFLTETKKLPFNRSDVINTAFLKYFEEKQVNLEVNSLYVHFLL